MKSCNCRAYLDKLHQEIKRSFSDLVKIFLKNPILSLKPCLIDRLSVPTRSNVLLKYEFILECAKLRKRLHSCLRICNNYHLRNARSYLFEV